MDALEGYKLVAFKSVVHRSANRMVYLFGIRAVRRPERETCQATGRSCSNSVRYWNPCSGRLTQQKINVPTTMFSDSLPQLRHLEPLNSCGKGFVRWGDATVELSETHCCNAPSFRLFGGIHRTPMRFACACMTCNNNIRSK
jgi:hypothetical protein